MPQNHMRIRDGGVPAAGPIGRRTGIGTRRFAGRPVSVARLDLGDRAAARADRHHSTIGSGNGHSPTWPCWVSAMRPY